MQLSIALTASFFAVAMQQPPENAAWLAFADSLATITDSRSLTRAADALRRQRDFRSHIRAGLMYHRVYEIDRAQRAFDRAAGLLKDGLKRAPQLPAIHYLAGRALVSGPHVTQRSGIITLKIARNVIGSSERERGVEALRFALRLDPMFAPAAVALARDAIESREREDLEAARDALRPIATNTRDTQALVLLSELERRLGDASAAVAALEPGAAAGAAATGAGTEYQRALALMLVPERGHEGVAAYWRGTVALDGVRADAYFADLAYIADPEDARAWRDTPLDAKADWLRRFWAYQAALSGIPVDDRILTHYQRLASARGKFMRQPSVAGRSAARSPSPSRDILDDSNAYRRDVDDRGLIWVKYGEPDHRITAGTHDYEAWVYERDNGNINFFFAVLQPDAPSAATGYSLFSGVTDCFGTGGDFLIQAARFEPELQKLYTSGCRNRDATRTTTAGITATLRERAYVNVRRNDASPRFVHDLPFHYTLYTLSAGRSTSAVVAAIAIPAEQLVRDSAGSYVLHASLIVADTVRGSVARTDTVIRVRSELPLKKGDYLRTHLQLVAAPAASTVYRVAIRDENAVRAGRIYGGARPVDAFAGGLALSDLILADTVASGAWRRGAARLNLVPMEEFAGGAFNLFYEIYDLPEGVYRTNVLIEPTDGATRRLLERALGQQHSRIELSFDGTVTRREAVRQELRRVGTALPPGRYRISLKITDAAGRHVERSRLLRVSP